MVKLIAGNSRSTQKVSKWLYSLKQGVPFPRLVQLLRELDLKVISFICFASLFRSYLLY